MQFVYEILSLTVDSLQHSFHFSGIISEDFDFLAND